MSTDIVSLRNRIEDLTLLKRHLESTGATDEQISPVTATLNSAVEALNMASTTDGKKPDDGESATTTSSASVSSSSLSEETTAHFHRPLLNTHSSLNVNAFVTTVSEQSDTRSIWDYLVGEPRATAFLEALAGLETSENAQAIQPTTLSQVKETLSKTKVASVRISATALVPTKDALAMSDFASAVQRRYASTHKSVKKADLPTVEQIQTAFKALLSEDVVFARQFLLGHVVLGNFVPERIIEAVDVSFQGRSMKMHRPLRAPTLTPSGEVTFAMVENPKKARDFFVKVYPSNASIETAATLMLKSEDNAVLSNGSVYFINRVLVGNWIQLYDRTVEKLGLPPGSAVTAESELNSQVFTDLDEHASWLSSYAPLYQALESLKQTYTTNERLMRFIDNEIQRVAFTERRQIISREDLIPEEKRRQLRTLVSEAGAQHTMYAVNAMCELLAQAHNHENDKMMTTPSPLESALAKLVDRVGVLEKELVASKREVIALVKRNVELQQQVVEQMKANSALQTQIQTPTQTPTSTPASALPSAPAPSHIPTATIPTLSPLSASSSSSSSSITTTSRPSPLSRRLFADPSDPYTVIVQQGSRK